jgi:hypothetical protein
MNDWEVTTQGWDKAERCFLLYHGQYGAETENLRGACYLKNMQISGKTRKYKKPFQRELVCAKRGHQKAHS